MQNSFSPSLSSSKNGGIEATAWIQNPQYSRNYQRPRPILSLSLSASLISQILNEASTPCVILIAR